MKERKIDFCRKCIGKFISQFPQGDYTMDILPTHGKDGWICRNCSRWVKTRNKIKSLKIRLENQKKVIEEQSNIINSEYGIKFRGRP